MLKKYEVKSSLKKHFGISISKTQERLNVEKEKIKYSKFIFNKNNYDNYINN